MNDDVLKSRTPGTLYVVRLTEEQIRVLRRELCKHCAFIREYPLNEDGNALEVLHSVDKALHAVAQCF